MNYIRRAGCPHPAASSRGYPSTGSQPRRGRRPPTPRQPPVTAHSRENLRAGHARPLPRGGGQALCRPQTPTEGSRPLPTDRPINECPHPAASSRGYPSTGSHPRRGRRPRRPGNLPSLPIPGKTSGPGMPGPYCAAVGKPYAVNKRPRRGQDPSLRTYPSTSAHTPPQVRAAARQRAVTHVGGGVPDAPETSCCRPSPGKPPGRACPAPTARRWASPMPSANARGGVKTPPYGPPYQRVPAPRRRFARQPVNGQPPT